VFEDEAITRAFERSRRDKGFTEEELTQVLNLCTTYLVVAQLIQKAIAGEIAIDLDPTEGLVFESPF
jgi:hypothetical protein